MPHGAVDDLCGVEWREDAQTVMALECHGWTAAKNLSDFFD